MTDVYYRYEDYLQSSGGYDMQGEWEPGPSVLRVRVLTFEIDKKTKHGAFVIHPTQLDGSMRRHFICDSWHKKYANPTLEGARQDFIARKRYLIAAQERRIRDARIAIETAARNVVEQQTLDGTPLTLRRVHSWEVELCR